MFAALVEPVLSELQKWCERTRQVDYDFLEQATWMPCGIQAMIWAWWWNRSIPISTSSSCCFAVLPGPSTPGFSTILWLWSSRRRWLHEEAKKHGVPVKEVDPKELHLLMTAYTNALFEVVVHDFTKEEALHYLDTMHQFFIPGWRAILGL